MSFIELTRREKNDLFNLALQVNERTPHHIFVSYSPHIETPLALSFYPEGWTTETEGEHVFIGGHDTYESYVSFEMAQHKLKEILLECRN